VEKHVQKCPNVSKRMGNKCGGRCFMKKSLCVPYAYGEKRLSVWEYLHP